MAKKEDPPGGIAQSQPSAGRPWTSHDHRDLARVRSMLQEAEIQVRLIGPRYRSPSADDVLRAELAAGLIEDAALRLRRFARRHRAGATTTQGENAPPRQSAA